MIEVPPRSVREVRAFEPKQMKEFSAQDLQKRIGIVQEAALQGPVAITFHGRRRHVMMALDEFLRLQRAASPKVYRISELPEDLLEAVSEAEMDTEHAHLDAELSGAPPGRRLED